jgi:hypothetical protein
VNIGKLAQLQVTQFPTGALTGYDAVRDADNPNIYWVLDSSSVGSVTFYGPDRMTDDKGLTAWCYGTRNGRVLFDLKEKKGADRDSADPIRATLEAVVVNLKEIPFRIEELKEPGRDYSLFAHQTLSALYDQIGLTNGNLLQLGFELVPDNDTSIASKWQPTTTELSPGYFRSQVQHAGDSANWTISDGKADRDIAVNARPDVLNIIFVDSLGGKGDDGSQNSGLTVSCPSLANTYASNVLKLTYSAEVGFDPKQHNMTFDTAGRDGGNKNQNWGIIVADNQQMFGGHGQPQLRNTVIEHEVGHFLGLMHREPAIPINQPPLKSDGIGQPHNLNIMDIAFDDNFNLITPAPFIDFDLPQVYVAQHMQGE